MKTDEQVRVDSIKRQVEKFEKMPAIVNAHSFWLPAVKELLDIIDANPPRVEGFPEEEALVAANERVAHIPSFMAGARWMHARMMEYGGPVDLKNQEVELLKEEHAENIRCLREEIARLKQPAPDERRGIAEIIETLQLAAQTAVPEETRREFIWKAIDALRSMSAPTEPTREQVAELVEAAKWVIANFMPGHMDKVSNSDCGSRLDRALAPFADKGGSDEI